MTLNRTDLAMIYIEKGWKVSPANKLPSTGCQQQIGAFIDALMGKLDRFVWIRRPFSVWTEGMMWTVEDHDSLIQKCQNY